MPLKGANRGRRMGTGTRMGFGGYLPQHPGRGGGAGGVQQGYPTRDGLRHADQNDLDSARGYQDELELPVHYGG